MDAALISTEQLRVAFAFSNLSGRAKSWVYTREATSPGCFTSWAQLCEQLRAAFLPANYEYCQRSRFLACKQGRRELHEYVQEIRELTASLVGNPLNEHIKMTVFMDGLRVGPARTQLFRVQSSTLEEAIQVALQEEYSHRQARTPASAWPGSSMSAPGRTSPNGPVPMELGSAEQRDIRCFGCGKMGHFKRDCPAERLRRRSFPKPVLKGRWQKPGSRGQGNARNQILIDPGASKNFARRQTIARNSNKLSDALRESKGNGTVSVRLADGKVVTVPNVQVDLAVKFEDFDSLEQLTVLDMDPYDMILGMPWLEKHEPWIDWRGKAIGASRPAQSDRALVSHVPTSVRTRGAREGCQGTKASGRCLGVVDVYDDSEDVFMVAAPRRGAGQVSNIGPQAGNLVPQTAAAVMNTENSVFRVGNRVPLTVAQTITEEEDVGYASCYHTSASDVVATTSLDVGSKAPRHRSRRQRRRRRRLKSDPNFVPIDVASSDSESRARAPPTRPVEECYHIFDGETGLPVKASGVHLEPLPEVAEILHLEEMTAESFLTNLKAGEIAEMVLMRPETTQEELNSSSVLDENVLEDMNKQRQARLGSEILKNPKDPVYPLVTEYSDVVNKHPPTQLPPDRGVRHEIDLVPGTKYCVTRQWPLPREQCEVIDAFFAAKAKAGMVRESKSPHSTPTFCVRKPNGKWRLVHAYNKLNNATVPAQTPIPRKDVLLNNMTGSVLYSALDLVDGYYQILMRENDIPLTAVSTPSGMLWEWLVMPQGLSNARRRSIAW
ncbi:Retroviral aspartyl protease [Phytophthora infestans]|uniref:Retroviral aspartyl protease n=1 Tax=Phytophthora infestans TaxID=4787 RepID=A0A8S9V7P8_PHYIN|nr:Retroviral aspartyl protease [Phytophthora infestans]